MAVAMVSIVPVGTPDASLSSYVAQCVDIVEKSGLTYELTPMATIIEGDPRRIFDVVLEMHESVFSDRIVRVLTKISLDDRRDKQLTMKGKLASVRRKRGERTD
ncbi:MAG: MTH1187 family thiamine-binding protein [Candidatus Eisenbacteria bacterium]|nr:MTH1187 family thiamine-binding protein [Candidatus Eisenbacteria bacterium]